MIQPLPNVSARNKPFGPGVLVLLDGAGQLFAMQPPQQVQARVRLTGPLAAVEMLHSYSASHSVPSAYLLLPVPAVANVSRFVAGNVNLEVMPGGCPDSGKVPECLRQLFRDEGEPVFCAALGALEAGPLEVNFCYAELVPHADGHFVFLLTLRSHPALGNAFRSELMTLTLEIEQPAQLNCSHSLAGAEGGGWRAHMGATRGHDFILNYRFERPNDGFWAQGYQRTQHFLVHLHGPETGVPAARRHRILVLDGSAQSEGTWSLGKLLVSRLLEELDRQQDSFVLVVFNDGLSGFEVGTEQPSSNAGLARAWLDQVVPQGPAQLEVLLDRLLQLSPDARDTAVYLISSNPLASTESMLANLNHATPMRFHCLALGPRVEAAFLRRLAAATGGSCHFLEPRGLNANHIQPILEQFRTPWVERVQVQDSGLKLTAETLLPARPARLDRHGPLVLTGLKSGTGNLRLYGHPDLDLLVQPVPSPNQALGMAWAMQMVQELADQAAFAAPDRAAKLTRMGTALALDYRLSSAFTSSVLTNSVTGQSHPLPPLLPVYWDSESTQK